MRALVTGGTGFIGSHLTEALLRKGIHVRCLIRKTSDLRWLRGLPVEPVHGDCNDKRSLEKVVKGVDWVFHLAGVTKAVKKETYFEVNGLGTSNLIHACLEKNPRIQKFIHISSQAAAGPSRDRGPKRELDSSEPVSFYGRSKRMGEKMVLAHAHELPVIILRPSAVYGPRDKDMRTLFKSLSRRLKPCPIGSDRRLSLCYAQDIIQGILLAGETRTKSGEIFFLSDGNDYRMQEVGDTVAQAMGVAALRIRIPDAILLSIASISDYLSRLAKKPLLLNKDKAKEMIQKNWVCDITKAKSLLGFEPRVSLAEGARLTVEWYRNEKWL